MIELWLVRHGESEGNAARMWVGHGDSPLSARGKAQAASFANRLRAHGTRFDRVVSSDLSRARDTAAAFATPETDADFREINIGTWDGRSVQEISRRQKVDLDAARSNPDFRVGGAESWNDVWARIEPGLEKLVVSTPTGGRTLLAAHGGVIALTVARLCSKVLLPMQSGFDRIQNTSVTVLGFDNWGQAPLVHVFNDVDHDLEVDPPEQRIRVGDGISRGGEVFTDSSHSLRDMTRKMVGREWRLGLGHKADFEKRDGELKLHRYGALEVELSE